MLKAALASLVAALLLAGPALAQGPGGGGPGPVPPPSPWLYAAPLIYAPVGSCVGMPQTVSGGCAGSNTINVAGGYYINGVPLAGIFSAAAPLSISGGVISLLKDSNFAVNGSNQLALASITAGYLLGNCTGSTAEPTGCSWPSFANQAISNSNNHFPARVGGAWVAESFGASVTDPGTGAIENTLPIQTNSTAGSSGACTVSCTFATGDLFKTTRRSNIGAGMSDTFPASSATGLANGTQINVANTDATASDTITAGAGTTINGAASYLLPAGRDAHFVYDLAGTNWWLDANTGTALIAPSGGLSANNPVVGGAISNGPVAQGTRSGNTTMFATTTGPQTSGLCVTIDANGNHVAAGASCGAGNQRGFVQDFVGGVDYTAGTTTTLQPSNAKFTGSVAGTTLTTSAVTGTIAVNQVVNASGVTAGTTIVQQLTGTPGGAGTYQLSASFTVSSESMTSVFVPPDTNSVSVDFDGVVQAHTTYSVSLVTGLVTFNSPIPVNTLLVEEQWYAATTMAGVGSINSTAQGAVSLSGGSGITVVTAGKAITVSSNQFLDVTAPPYNVVPGGSASGTDWSATIQSAINTGSANIYFPILGPAQYVYCMPEGIVFTESYQTLIMASPAVTLSSCPVNFTGSISGTTLTISAILYGSPQLNNVVYGSGVSAGTKITACPGGVCGGTGAYTVSNSQTVSSETMRIGLDSPLVTMGGVSQQFSNDNIVGGGIFNGPQFGAVAPTILVNNAVNSHIYGQPIITGGIFAFEYLFSSDFRVENPFVYGAYGDGTAAGGANVFTRGGGLYLDRPKIDQGFPGGNPTNSFGTLGWPAWAASTNYSYGNVVACGNYYIQVVSAGTKQSGPTACPQLTNYNTTISDGSNGLQWQLLAPTQFYAVQVDGAAVDTYDYFGDHTGPYTFGLATTNVASAASAPQLTHVTGGIFASAALADINAQAGAGMTVTDSVLVNCVATNCAALETNGYGGGTCAGQRAWCGDLEVTDNIIYGSVNGIVFNAGTNNSAQHNVIGGAATALSSASAIGTFIWTGNLIGASATWGANTLGINIGASGNYQVITNNNCNGATTGHSGSVGVQGVFANNAGC